MAADRNAGPRKSNTICATKHDFAPLVIRRTCNPIFAFLTPKKAALKSGQNEGQCSTHISWLPPGHLAKLERMTQRIFATAALVLAIAASAAGQRYSFKTYTQDQGLQNTAVQHALQDRDGLIWVATQNGLFWYDGKEFRQIDDPGIPGKYIQSLYESGDRTLWVGSRFGLSRRRGN